MKEEIPFRIREEMRKKKIENRKNMFFLFIVLVLISAMLTVFIDEISVNKQKKEYASKVRSSLKTGPIQVMLLQKEKIEFKGVEITKLAKYDITGKVIGMEFFRFGGGKANKISPQDLTVCWGPAVSPIYEGDIKSKYTANDRSASIVYGGRYAADFGDNGMNYVSNNHIIPLNGKVKNTLYKVRKGDTVKMLGWLVECKGKNWTWGPSSLVRTDRGNGACEIVLVEYLEIID